MFITLRSLPPTVRDWLPSNAGLRGSRAGSGVTRRSYDGRAGAWRGLATPRLRALPDQHGAPYPTNTARRTRPTRCAVPDTSGGGALLDQGVSPNRWRCREDACTTW